MSYPKTQEERAAFSKGKSEDFMLGMAAGWEQCKDRYQFPDTPAPLTYTPAQVIEMVRKADRNGAARALEWPHGQTFEQLLTTLGLNQ